MAENSVDLIIDLEKPKDQLIEELVGLLAKNKDKIDKEGNAALNIVVKKKGHEPKSISYNVSKDDISEGEKDYLFPKVVAEVIKKEFNPKIASNEKLVGHIMEDLKKDPYWSNRVTKIIKALKEGK
ncbi:MAG: hypothetical protein U0354_10020 [Candidatus Sericytochromatia bacterium]